MITLPVQSHAWLSERQAEDVSWMKTERNTLSVDKHRGNTVLLKVWISFIPVLLVKLHQSHITIHYVTDDSKI